MTALAEQVEAARAELAEKIDGGPHVAWPQSLRGRLHTLESESAAAKAASTALAEAQRERRKAREERDSARRDRLKTWMQIGGVAVAAVAVMLPYVVHFAT